MGVVLIRGKGTPSQNLRDMWEWGARSKPNFSVGVK